MKKLRALAMTVIVAVTMTVVPMFQGVSAGAAFDRTAGQTVDDIILGWNLGNTLDAYMSTSFGSENNGSETSWGNPSANQGTIDQVKASGMNAVRVPVTWYNHMDPGTYRINSDWMRRVKEVVDYVMKDDMYCILNVHHDTGEKGWLRASRNGLDEDKRILKAIWEQVSAEFEGYGDKLMFEGFNEILNESNEWVHPSKDDIEVVNELNQLFVDTVRASGGNNAKRVLIVNTYCAGGGSTTTNGFVLPTDTISDRLIVEAHIYQPFEFTFETYQDVRDWDKSTLDAYLANMNSQFVSQGIPVIIGEFGAANKNNTSQRASWAEYYVRTCTGYGIKCFWWDNGNEYKIFNRGGGVAEPDIVNAMIKEAKKTDLFSEVPTEAPTDPPTEPPTETPTEPPTQQPTEPQTVAGDVNADQKLSVLDIVALQKWLLAIPGASLQDYDAADLNGDTRIDIIDLALLKRLVMTGTFSSAASGKTETGPNLCADASHWGNWFDSSAGGEGEVSQTADGVSASVTGAGTDPWSAQVSYGGLTIEQGVTYQLSFDYTATHAQTCDVLIQQAHDEYDAFFTAEVSYGTSKQHFEKTFTMQSATDDNCQIAFNLGGTGVSVPYTATIENLKLVKMS